MALSDCAAKMCDALTARQFGGAELFLKLLWSPGVGCRSWMWMPTSLVAVLGIDFADERVAVTKLSVSIAEGVSPYCRMLSPRVF